MKKKIQKLIKNKYFLVYACIFLVLLICIISIKNFLFPSNSNTNYGNRLDGIKDVPFTKSDQKKIIEKIDSNEKASKTQIKLKGKIINILYTVNDDVSIDDAKAIASDSLSVISEKEKKFYDIQIFISKKTNSEGFPLIGYKNSSSKEIVW